MYFGRITNGNIENVLLNTGSPNGQYTTTFKANTAGAPQFANIFTGTGAASSTPNSYFFAPNLQNPMVHEFDLQIQQELGRGTFFQVSYLGSLGRELPNFLNLNLNPTTVNTNITVADPTGKGPLTAGSVFSVPTYTSYGNTNLFGTAASHFQSITEFTSNINSSYNALVMEVQNNNLKLVHWDANYTWAHALDYAQNANTQGTATQLVRSLRQRPRQLRKLKLQRRQPVRRLGNRQHSQLQRRQLHSLHHQRLEPLQLVPDG